MSERIGSAAPRHSRRRRRSAARRMRRRLLDGAVQRYQHAVATGAPNLRAYLVGVAAYDTALTAAGAVRGRRNATRARPAIRVARVAWSATRELTMCLAGRGTAAVAGAAVDGVPVNTTVVHGREVVWLVATIPGGDRPGVPAAGELTVLDAGAGVLPVDGLPRASRPAARLVVPSVRAGVSSLLLTWEPSAGRVVLVSDQEDAGPADGTPVGVAGSAQLRPAELVAGRWCLALEDGWLGLPAERYPSLADAPRPAPVRDPQGGRIELGWDGRNRLVLTIGHVATDGPAATVTSLVGAS